MFELLPSYVIDMCSVMDYATPLQTHYDLAMDEWHFN
jgi:hypothetical protein